MGGAGEGAELPQQKKLCRGIILFFFLTVPQLREATYRTAPFLALGGTLAFMFLAMLGFTLMQKSCGDEYTGPRSIMWGQCLSWSGRLQKCFQSFVAGLRSIS